MVEALAAALVCVIAAAAFTACANDVSEKGEWVLSFFGDGAQNYSVGEEYRGSEVTEQFYTCCFDGSLYEVRQNGTAVLAGSYTARRAGERSLLLALETDGETLYWNCGVAVQPDGTETLSVTGGLGGLALVFVPRAE